MKPEETVEFNIRSTWHKIARMYNNNANRHDLTLAMGQVLLHINLKAGTPSTKLGPMMGMESTSLSRLLKSLEDKDLIYRQADAADGRMVRIFLTEAGRKKRDISKLSISRFNKSLRSEIAPKKLDTFFEVCQIIEDLIDKQEGK